VIFGAGGVGLNAVIQGCPRRPALV
jgi:hypothetical protein